jgi:pimeloyl-ACP methyl ester carboxylesterase
LILLHAAYDNRFAVQSYRYVLVRVGSMMDATPRPHGITISSQSVQVWIDGKDPGLLLLHAAWGDAEMPWGGIWNELARLITIIAPDLPGCGRSSAPPKSSLSYMAKLQIDLLATLAMEKIIVVGNSFGAAVATQ